MLLPLRSVAALDLAKNELRPRSRSESPLTQVALTPRAAANFADAAAICSVESPCLKTSSRHRKDQVELDQAS